jgi:hypothetical protein
MGHSGWAYTSVSAAAVLTATALAATPAAAEVDCFPHAASAPYSRAAAPPPLPVAVLRPLGGEALVSRAGPPRRAHAAAWRRPGGHRGAPRVHHVSHPHPGPDRPRSRHAQVAPPQPGPSAVATGVDAGATAPMAALTRAAARPQACAPAAAAPPISIGPTLAAAGPFPGGFAGLLAPHLPPDTGTPGTAVDTPSTTATTDTDTIDIIPVAWTAQPPEVVIVGSPGGAPGGGSPGGPGVSPGGVPEPSVWAMMVMGLLGAGAALRARRRRAADQAAAAPAALFRAPGGDSVGADG